ncbi:UNVERIFIED_ASMBLY: apoptosis regulator BHRF1 [human gammaherpesvirus 4]|uniref:BHRF1 n=1 Tax=Epstein-Barr virus (strain GD1) TaxID=10376 RepID=A0A0C7TQI4_EBVG|nr:BHRF1 [human gammaherpesvirus 4]QCF54999.1 apoptosis regulator BHRF1 [human gammaherpesvirus 4]CEQ33745.1 BHRF1 [human gammaherpesvirus 4]
MAYSTRDILLALCIRDSRVHGNGALHPVLELAARETPPRLSPEDTVVLRYHVLLEEIIERNSETFTETWNRFITHTENLDLDFNSVFLEIFHRGDPSLGRALAWMAWCMHACRTLCCNQYTPYYVVDLSVRGMLEASEGLDGWIHQQGGWSTLIENNIPGSRRFSWTLFLAGLTLSLLVICSYLFISRGRH